VIQYESFRTMTALGLGLARSVVIQVGACSRTCGGFLREDLIVRALDDVLAVNLVAFPLTGFADAKIFNFSLLNLMLLIVSF
jgi:hypothetical protein